MGEWFVMPVDARWRKTMAYRRADFEKLAYLVQQHSPEEGANWTPIAGVGTVKLSSTQAKRPAIDVRGLVVFTQGRKNCYVGDRVYEYSPGKVLMMFHPLAVEVEYVEASPEKPLLAAGVLLELGRLADVLLKIERVEGVASGAQAPDPSGVFQLPLTDQILDPMIRLLESAQHATEAAILGDSIVDEIYYRLLSGERESELRVLLQQRGQVQRISKAVEHIHQNVDKPVSVEGLAEMVHMSRTSFYESFRDVMHLSPLQYAKSVKLDRAQSLIREGKNATEAGYMVGYNSPAQFSREYKRHFGYSPSATSLSYAAA
jgi:AraC-like DNA-binding protein